MSRGEKPVAGSGFRWGEADQKRFPGLLHAASVSAGPTLCEITDHSPTTASPVYVTFQHILVSILALLCGAMPRTKLFPEALQHDCEHQVFTMDQARLTVGAKWYFVWSADMGFGLAALAAFLRRAVGRTMVSYAGAMECSVCQVKCRASCGHLPAANHRALISTATLRHYRGYACHLRKCIRSRDCFLCDLPPRTDNRRINLFLGVQVTNPCRFPSSPPSFLGRSFLPRRMEHNGRLEPARKLHRCVLGPAGQLLPHSRDRWCLLPGL